MIVNLAVATVQAIVLIAAVLALGTMAVAVRQLWAEKKHAATVSAAVLGWAVTIAALALVQGIGIYWGWWGTW